MKTVYPVKSRPALLAPGGCKTKSRLQNEKPAAKRKAGYSVRIVASSTVSAM